MTPAEAIEMLTGMGWTQVAIAQATGVSQPNISRIHAGSEPGYSDGAKIVKFAENAQRAALRAAKKQAA